MTAAVQGIRSISFVPLQGEHSLCVNLALVDPALVWDVAKELGFNPELVQIASRFGIEIHALLFFEQTDGEPMGWTELDSKIEQLADRIAPSAIRHVYGGRMIA